MSRLFAALLLALFVLPVLTGCAPSARLAEQEQTIARLDTRNDSLRTELAALRDTLRFYDDIDTGRYYRERRTLLDRIERLRYRLAVAGDGGTVAEVLLVDDLFAPASADLTDAGRTRLDSLAARLARDFADHAVRIEAHADNVPIGPGLVDRYPSNWELSAARASAVVRHLTTRHEVAPERLEAVGLGEARPRATNATAAGRLQNRRIEVVVVPDGETQAGL